MTVSKALLYSRTMAQFQHQLYPLNDHGITAKLLANARVWTVGKSLTLITSWYRFAPAPTPALDKETANTDQNHGFVIYRWIVPEG